MKKNKLMLILGGIGVAIIAYLGYKHFTTSKAAISSAASVAQPAADKASGTPTGTTTTLPLSQAAAGPPPGYGGPNGGPYTWAGVGDPPDGVYEINFI
jgi:hypothetical protein